ncbi:hypothetical protein LAZ67_2001358 [Cordylochernes scorpioides]|uniref:Reverse transcriptase n=1 Tax=Cordylochernes scorpioides TaxID=51811 RepID=A0ABY6K199_9ARAC|nr:hypothetical protein LAZ67_2001358 [Cordylochernes scorpioides]
MNSASQSYEEEFAKQLLETLIEDRERIEERERIEDRKRIEDRERIERERKEQMVMEFELEKLRIQTTRGNNDTSRSTSNDAHYEIRKLMPKYESKDNDLSFYLILFERQAKRLGLDEDQWAFSLLGLLPYEMTQLIARETEEQSGDYRFVKRLLLKRYKLSPEQFRQKFEKHERSQKGSWRDFAFELRGYFNEWIEGMNVENFDALKDLSVTNQLKKKNELADKLDEYENVRTEMGPPHWNAKHLIPPSFQQKSARFPNQSEVKETKQGTNVSGQDAARNEISETYPNTLRRMVNRTIRNDKGEPKCFNCNQFGHIARDCPAPRTTLTCRGCGQTGHKERNCTRPKEGLKVANLEVEGLETVPPDVYLKDVKIDNKETVKAMIDTGSSSCLMRESVARRISVDIEPDSTSLYGIGNQTAPAARTVGKTTVDLEIDGIVGREITVFIVNDDAQPYDLLIGRTWTDLPYVSFARIGKNLHIGYSSEFPFANLQEEIKSRRIELRATETVQLESDSINLTSAITDEVKDGYLLFTGVDDACVDSLLEVVDGKTTVPIISAGKGKLRVRKNQCVGRVELLNLDDIVVNLDVAEDSFQTKNEEKREGQDLMKRKRPILPEDINVNHSLTSKERQEILDVVNEYRDCFALGMEELGCTDVTKMDIKEVDGSKPVCLRPYKTTASEREAIREIVREWKDNGIVTETRSPYASPVLLVRKKTGDHRLVVDYRRLNIQTVKDKFPLPRIDDLLEGLRNAKFFTTLDLAHGYLQIPLTDKAKLKTAFITPDDTGQFERMIFGLANAPAEFQRLMHTVLGPLLNKKAFCYLDDVIIPAKDWREMIERLREVLERIRSAKLTLKPSKCEFGRREVEFLGYVISTGGLKPGPRKIKAIEEFPEPKNVHDIRRFLGLTNFFRRFVKDFARKAEPLSRLTKKGSQFEWKEEQRRSFGGLRKDLVEYPVLAHYNPELKTEVHCDASAEGLAGMVLQMDEDCKWRLVYCVSKKTTEAEKMYHSSKLELMAIVWTLDRLRQFLVGIKFTVVTDCQALVYINAKKTTNPQIARWYNLIQEYDFEIRHKPGEKMAHVDGMSRAPVDDPRDTMEEIVEKNLEVCLTITLEEQILMIQHSDPELRDLIQIFRKDPCDRTVGEQNRINDYSYRRKSGRGARSRRYLPTQPTTFLQRKVQSRTIEIQEWPNIMRYFVFLLLAATSWAQEETVSVSTSNWEIIGKRMTFKDLKVDQFTGIPYAEPPVGSLRFMKPLPLREFPKKLEAINPSPSCLQVPLKMEKYYNISSMFPQMTKQEDCLFLNIWRPANSVDPAKQKAVMIWVYGGSFLAGSITFPFYNGLALSGLGDVVVVTVNYRVGSFGLLTAATADEPGNLALYDQQLAFTWVKDNIHHFGGDPSKITIFGESAGGMSIAAHVTSPKSKGLFQRAIIQSGTTLNSNFIKSKDTVLEKSNQIANYSGCLENDVSLSSHPDQVLNCLRSKDPEVLLQAEYKFMEESDKYDQMGIIFDEEFLDYKSLFPFLPKMVNEAQLMIGVTKDEMGALLSNSFDDMMDPDFKLTKEKAYEIPKRLMKDITDHQLVDKIIHSYLKDVDENNITALDIAMTQITSDLMFTCPSMYFVDNELFRKNDIHFYYYTQHSNFNILQRKANWTGAFHFDEVLHVFGFPLLMPMGPFSDLEKAFSMEIIELWSSFAKSGPQKDPFVKEIPLVEEKGSTSEVESRTEIESESDLEMSDLVDEPSESEVVISRRGRGRPRYIRTGKPGRPRKEYPTANLSTEELLEAKYLPDPKDAEEALSGRASYFWKKAMEEEFDSLIENKTWELVDPPKNRNIIGTKWVFKTKCNSDGSVERHKARLVAKGYSQQYGIDYEETFAPVVRQSTIRMFLALAVEYNLILHQMDVQSAYLNGEIKEEIYMTQPENFVSRKYPERVCRLKKAIYGLKQAGIVWHERLDNELKYLGLKQIQSDNCVYIKHHEGILLVAIFVDDLIIAAEREDTLKSFKESMKRIFKIKDLGGINCCLGIRIQMKEDGSISIDQERYIEELLAKYRMKEAKPISTPMDSNSKLTKISSIEVSTRPDIAYAVSALGQFSNDPRRQHWNAAKRVLRYLKGTSCLRITYRKSNEALHGYVDADWGGNLVDRKSHTGIVYFLARGPIAWESKKQQTVTLSSTESEYIALCEAGKEAVYLRALLDEMGFGELLNGPTVLKTDNQGAQQLARNPVYHARTKHIDIKWHFIRSICSDGLVEVVHTPTQENVADILTKGLPSQETWSLVVVLMTWKASHVELVEACDFCLAMVACRLDGSVVRSKTMRYFLFLFLAATSWAQEETVSVSSPNWEIIGKRMTFKDHKVDQFTGIPYAEPPVGSLRFKKPLPLKEFPKKIEALNPSPSCLQVSLKLEKYLDISTLFPQMKKQEDCLYLNIWRPANIEDTATKKAVMIWVYGGAFLTGSISFPFYNGLALAGLGDVVVVAVNYRVGSFGLLTAATADEPGNLALYDQQLAFTWVKDNIHHFGGDPSKITIFGESAGGISISAHVTSPKSKGLFQRAIIQSGTTLMPNIILNKDSMLEKSNKIAEYSGCLENDVSLRSHPDQVLNCMRSKDPEVLLQAEFKFMEESYKYDQLGIIFDEEFLDYKSIYPFQPSTVNEAQIMIGATKDEMGSLLPTLFDDLLNPDFVLTKEKAFEIPKRLMKDIHLSNQHSVDKIINSYLKDIDESDTMALDIAMTQVTSDLMFTCPSMYFVDNELFRESDIHFYYYTHHSSFSILPRRANWTGAFHFDEVLHVFGLPLMMPMAPYSDLEKAFSMELMELWSSFAKSGYWIYTPQVPRSTLFLRLKSVARPGGKSSRLKATATSWAQEERVSVSSLIWEIIGKRMQFQDRIVDQFTGIPYAEPPVGSLRFKKPLPLKEFPKKIDASNQAPSCFQVPLKMEKYVKTSSFLPPLTKKEDCLYLNIWRPVDRADSSTDKAVMIWVYGGGFLTGSIEFPFYNGLALAGLGDVVVVTVNYRLGSFGLLTAGTADEPGNLALYDQQLAFTWVKDNIHHFGGDPSRITIFGESAGGISISAHVTSPKSKGLFQRAIIQSGTTLAPTIVLSKDSMIKRSDKVAKNAGCLEEGISLKSHPDQVLSCLRSKSPELLLQAEYQFNDEFEEHTQLGIIYDEEILDYKSLLPFQPSIVNDVQLMIGVTKDEMGVLLPSFFDDMNAPDFVLTKEKAYEIPLRFMKDIPNKKLLDKIIHSYLKDIDESNTTALDIAMTKVASDLMFTCPSMYFVDNELFRQIDIHFYYYTHHSSFNLFPNKSNWTGAYHFNDVFYVFGLPLIMPSMPFNDLEKAFSVDIIDLWTSFAKSGYWIYTPQVPRSTLFLWLKSAARPGGKSSRLKPTGMFFL